MVAKLRAAVVGAGVFGGYHAAKYAERPDVDLTAILDPHPDRARALADRHGARTCSALEELFEEADVVSICAPAQVHAALALACLAAGKSVYVEKPLATSLADADAIVAQGHRRGLTGGLRLSRAGGVRGHEAL